MPVTNPTAFTHEAWLAEARRRFGDDARTWSFLCPVCGWRASVQDWKAAGAPEGAVAFSCVGRWRPNPRDAFGGEGAGPCNYAGGGLFALNPVRVTMPDGTHHDVFQFAERAP